MTFENILIDCIRFSDGISATSAAEYIGVSQTTFGKWRRHKETSRFPHPDHLVKIAKLSGHPLPEVIVAYLQARCENPETAKAYANLTFLDERSDDRRRIAQ